jgi:hypothetical protein
MQDVLSQMERAGIALVAKLYLTNPELKHVYRPCLAIIVQSHVWYQDEDYYSTYLIHRPFPSLCPPTKTFKVCNNLQYP